MTGRTVVLLVGQQGTGKSTLGRGLVRETGGLFISGGELIRSEITRRTILGRNLKAQIGDAERADPKTMYKLLRRALRRETHDLVFLDGFPSAASEVPLLTETIGTSPRCVLLLEGPPTEVLVDRLRYRVECTRCFAPFGSGGPDVCTWCGGALSSRPEDENPAKIAKRHRFWSQNRDGIQRVYGGRAGIVRTLDVRPAADLVLDEALAILDLDQGKRP